MVKRGQVWWADLPDPFASEPGYRRPVLVVQSDEFNSSKINTVIAIALTTNLSLADAPGNVRLATQKTGLARESVANVSQLVAISKQLFDEMVAELDRRTMQQVDDGMRLVLAL